MLKSDFKKIDLMPPPFSDGLYDWSRGDGTPDSHTYADLDFLGARIAQDEVFGPCLELRKSEPVQRLRYMGEMPIRSGSYISVTARLKALRGPLGFARIAALPGGRLGRPLPDLHAHGATVEIKAHDQPYEVAAVFGPEPLPGVAVIWGESVLYAHVGLDIIGPIGGVMRIENLCVRDVTEEVTGSRRVLPGFTAADYPARFRSR